MCGGPPHWRRRFVWSRWCSATQEKLEVGWPKAVRRRSSRSTSSCARLRSTVSKEGGARWQTCKSPRNGLKAVPNARSPNSRDELGSPVVINTDQKRLRLAAYPNCLALIIMFWPSNLRAAISDWKMSRLLMTPDPSTSP